MASRSVWSGLLRPQAGGLPGVDAQGLQEPLVDVHLPAQHPPVDAPAVHQGVKLLLGELRPLRPDLPDGLRPGEGVVVAQPLQPHPLRLQPGGQQGLLPPGEPPVNEPDGPLQIPHVPPAGDVGGQGVAQMQKRLVLCHRTGLPFLIR